MTHFTRSGLAVLLAALLLAPAAAQLRVSPVTDQEGRVGLGLLLRKLDTIGTLMMATAHPDDENNALLAAVGLGGGMRTVLATATRGSGGQNEIGPELFDALAVLRTEELLSAHRFDGAEQYFTRAIDFGYTFSIEETFELWGRDEILGDFVRLIRMTRPDVIVGLRPDGTGGGQHHEASARLAREAFDAAADPARFPEQMAEGLRPWQAKKFYFMAGFGFRDEEPPPAGVDVVSVDVSGYDPLLGRTYAEIGGAARSMHKCQSMPQLLPLPGPAAARYYLAGSNVPEPPGDPTLFGGVHTRLVDLARFAGPSPPPELTGALEAIADRVRRARDAVDARGLDAAVPELAAGLSAVRTLRETVAASPAVDDMGRFEIDFRLRQKEAQFERALVLAQGLHLAALAGDGVVTPGQPVTVALRAASSGSRPVQVVSASVSGFDTAPPCTPSALEGTKPYTCELEVGVPAAARSTSAYFQRLDEVARYRFEPDAPFGLPFEPSPFTGTFELQIGGERVTVTRPVEHRYERNIFAGEKRMELHVVPDLAVDVSPRIVVFPAAGSAGSATTAASGNGAPGPRAREVRVTVTNAARGTVGADVSLELPAGWRAEPASVPLSFGREDESRTVRFRVTPRADAAEGEHRVAARVTAGGRTFDRGYQIVEYPHIQRRHLVHEAVAVAKVIDVAIATDLRIGYVMGSGDEVAAALAQLGATVELLDADALAWGDLSRYDTIVTGIRAYERRPDLQANNARLLEFVERGGTLVVQYNRFEFNREQYGPYPVEVSRNRVTDEDAPVRILVPDHPVFQRPNRVGPGVWEGWVQERGLYFLGERDPRYVDLLELQDPFENNPGVKRGALVEARYGQGRWIYVGLGLWRQLPAGTAGAYQLLANLVSLTGR